MSSIPCVSRRAPLLLGLLLLPMSLHAQAVEAPAACAAQQARGPGGQTVAAAADSLFALATTRGGRGAYVLVPFTARPREVGARRMPDELTRDASAMAVLQRGAEPVFAFLLDPEGRPARVELVRGSGSRAVDAAALEAVRNSLYRPAQNGDCAVPFFGVDRLRWQVRSRVREVRTPG